MLCGMRLVPVRSRRNALVAVLFLVIGGVATHGQKPSQGGGGPLLIDFTAVTADGKPVEDLTAADVAVRIGGKARTVSSLELKKVQPAAAPAAAAATAAAPAAGDITAPFATNEAKAAGSPAATVGRSFLIVVDTESLTTAADAAVKGAIEGLLKGLTDADRVAFSTAPRDTAQVGFGTGLARVRQAVAALQNQKPATVSDADGLCRTAQTLAELSTLIVPLASSATPTSVVFIAGTLSSPDKKTSSSGGVCEVLVSQYQTVADTAAEARANMYVVQGDPGAMRDTGLEMLAGATGAGQVGRVIGDGFAPKVLADASNYWVATIAPDPVDRVGQAQPLQVKASRDGVTIHARAFAAVPRMAPGAAAAPPAKPGTVTPKEMIASPAQFADLQLRATAIFQRGQADKMNVLVTAEPVDPTVKIAAMRVGYLDQSNKGASVDAPQIATYPITTVLPMGVGQYRIRVAATDSSGKSGAVDVPINTTMTAAGPLKVSSLLIGASTDKGLSPRLQFGTEEKMLVFLEVYGQITAGLSVKFEVAKSDAGPALDTLPPAGGGPTNEPDKIQVYGEIPLAKYAPGDYVLRAIVGMEGSPEGKVMRTFRKVAK